MSNLCKIFFIVLSGTRKLQLRLSFSTKFCVFTHVHNFFDFGLKIYLGKKKEKTKLSIYGFESTLVWLERYALANLKCKFKTEFLRSTVLWCTLVPRIKQRIGGYFSVPLSFVEVTSARSEAWDDWLNMLRQQAL